MLVDIFPVPIYNCRVDGFEVLNDILSAMNLHEFVVPTNNQKSSNRHWNCSVLTGHDEHKTNTQQKWVQLFLDLTSPYVRKYMRCLSIKDTDIDFEMSVPWINIYQQNHHQELHEHIGLNNLFSYVYFHKLPENSGKLIFRNRNHMFNLFGQENQEMVMTAPFDFCPEVQEGSLLIFPCWLEHSVTENKSKEERVTLSGNVKLVL